MKSKKNIVVITGGAGFIGSAVTNELVKKKLMKKGYEK